MAKVKKLINEWSDKEIKSSINTFSIKTNNTNIDNFKK